MKTVIISILLFAIVANSLSCQVGQYLAADGNCTECDPSCRTCNFGNACATCHDQMFLNYKENKVICGLCYLVNLGCQTCITATKCLNCSAGFYLQADNTCTSCSKVTTHCLLCRRNNQTKFCISCRSPFKLNNGICQTNQTIPNNTIQIQTPNNNPPPEAQTLIQNTSPSQVKCDSNEIIINNTCFQSKPFCQEYQQTGQCKKCYFNFPIDNGKCTPSILTFTQNKNEQPSTQGNDNQPTDILPNLPECTDRQYFSINESRCIEVNSFCKSFKKQNGECLECIQGFSLKKTLCIQNVPVKQPQKKCNSPCLSCQISNKNYCLSCEQGHAIVDEIPGQCFKI